MKSYEELVKEALVLADRADGMSEDSLTTDAVKCLIAYMENKDKRLSQAHNELCTLYRSIESFAQPRLLSHIIVIGKMLESAINNEIPEHID